MGFGAVNVDLGNILTSAKGIGEGIHSVLTGLRAMITGKEPINATKLAELEAELIRLDTQLQTNQVEVNKIEAQHSSLFIAGWRPYIGWILGTAIGIYFIPMFVIGTYLWAQQVITTGVWISVPDLGIGQVVTLTGSMLGLSTLRTMEKKWSVQGSH